jgi:hypothetical protein
LTQLADETTYSTLGKRSGGIQFGRLELARSMSRSDRLARAHTPVLDVRPGLGGAWFKLKLSRRDNDDDRKTGGRGIFKMPEGIRSPDG